MRDGAEPEGIREDFLPLQRMDYVEFYVGNARQAAHYYRAVFGMRLAAYSGPETGTRDRASYVLEQGKIRFVMTTPLNPDHHAVKHIRVHGDGVRDLAMTVDDAAYRETTRRGVQEPTRLEDADGGAVVCSFVPRPLEEAPDALKVPFFHRNTDYDEFIFYHGGDFFSRDNIRAGMATLHPHGIHLGPHPRALRNQDAKRRPDEYAVMLDWLDPIRVLPAGEAVEWAEYWQSWMEK